jgi:inner membrane protein
MRAAVDNVTHFVLGASVAGCVLGRRTRAWRAVVWGGLLAELPDLDVLIEHSDAIANMTCHRGASHSLFWLAVASPLCAFAAATLHRERDRFVRWWIAVLLAMLSHPLCDVMTIYGTRLLLPFTDRPFGVGSLFVIDPLVTLPMLAGVVAFLRLADERGAKWLRRGLAVSLVYTLWSVAAQQWAGAVARRAFEARGVAAQQVLATPAPLQTLLWRLVVLTDDGAYEGFWSVFDGARAPQFTRIELGDELRPGLRGNAAFEQLDRFAAPFVKLARDGDGVRATDLRMGQEPYYVFSFVVARADAAGLFEPVAPQRSSARIDVGRGLAWLWSRMWGADLPPPR